MKRFLCVLLFLPLLLSIQALASGDCSEAYKKYQTSKDDFWKSCPKFSSSCYEDLEKCAMCPDGINHNSYNCQKMTKAGACPQLSGEVLTAAKKARDDYETKKESFEDDVKDLKNDLTDIQNDITELQAESSKEKADIQAAFSEAQDELEEAAKTSTEEINDNFKGQVEGLKDKLSNTLEAKFKFEEAVLGAGEQLGQAKSKALEYCRQEALVKLERYRVKRQQAIRDGRYKKNSVIDLLGKKRVSFATLDNNRLNANYQMCMQNAGRPAIKQAEKEYQQNLKKIDQQKQIYLQKMQELQGKIQELNQKANEDHNKLLQDYTSKLQKQTDAFQKAEQAVVKDFAINAGNLQNQQAQKQSDLQLKTMELEEVKKSLFREREAISQLQEFGVKEHSDKQDAFEDTLGFMNSFYSGRADAFSACSCSESVDTKNCRGTTGWKRKKCEKAAEATVAKNCNNKSGDEKTRCEQEAKNCNNKSGAEEIICKRNKAEEALGKAETGNKSNLRESNNEIRLKTEIKDINTELKDFYLSKKHCKALNKQEAEYERIEELRETTGQSSGQK